MDARTLPTCYRHGDRETRLSCSSCERPICVECVRTAAVGQKCPECARPQGDARVITAAELYGTSLRRSSPVTFGIITACVVVFVLGMVGLPVAALGAQINVLIAEGQWWRLVTAAFLHSGLMHLVFNMYALYLFGPSLERQVGSGPFAGLYLASAIAGGSAFYLTGLLLGGSNVAVGASGAVFGLFGATLAAAWRGRSTVAGRAGLRALLTMLAINLALPLVLPMIAWQAHLGGLLAGFVIAIAWSAIGRRPRGTVLRNAVAALIAVAALVPVLLL